jgi:membrane-bound lytic murein transglycosylase D
MPEPAWATRSVAGYNPVAREYVIQRGDSLWSISRRFKVSQRQLIAWNGISEKDYLQPGQKLRIAG